MGGPKKNKHAVKLKDEDLKIKAYEDYCAHLASGKDKRGWYFEVDGEFLCTYRTIEKYMNEMPQVLDPQKKEVADCKSYLLWEKKGTDMMEGKKKSETALYQMFMRNKFGWDKPKEITELDTDKLASLTQFFKTVSSKPLESKSTTNSDHNDSSPEA
jgi:hypothetical protein